MATANLAAVTQAIPGVVSQGTTSISASSTKAVFTAAAGTAVRIDTMYIYYAGDSSTGFDILLQAKGQPALKFGQATTGSNPKSNIVPFTGLDGLFLGDGDAVVLGNYGTSPYSVGWVIYGTTYS